MRLVLPLLLVLAGPAGRGDADFTRIVIEASALRDWHLGQIAGGYELAAGPEITGFDLSRAFQKIPRDRVSGLWRDVDTGRLHIALACACQAVAFELRPGIVVIDVKAGAPRNEEIIETLPDAAPPAEPSDRGQYNWLALREETIAAPAPAALVTEDIDFSPLREALLEQVARGVAEGVVDVAQSPDLAKPRANLAEVPGLRIGLGELPGVKARNPHDPMASLTADGGICLADQQFQVETWILDGPVAAQIGPGRSGLLGEFDTPKTAAVLRATRLYLALGFGAEARQMIDLLSVPDEEAAFLREMTWIVDLEPPPANPLAGQENCDSTSALWATLALAVGGDEPARPINANAVARSFSALPVHLRRQLSPTLTQFFLQRGDTATARLLRDATLRPSSEAGTRVDLMDAGYRLATGDADGAAKEAMTALASGGGDGPDAAIMLVHAAFAGDRVVPSDLPATIAAFLIDARRTDREARLARALVLAFAMSDDFEAAFDALAESPQTAPELWQLAADAATDDVLLRHALIVPSITIDDDTVLRIAGRLQALGFPQQALGWLGRGKAPAAEARMIAARAHLALRDARATILVLEGDRSKEAEDIRARALLQLGDVTAAAAAFDRADLAEKADAARRAAAEWPLVAEIGAEPWKTAALHALPPRPADPTAGPIAQAVALSDDSAASMTAATALLDAVLSPAP
jgi:hypothetical protein